MFVCFPGNGLQDPHWLKSLNQLTELDTTNHRLPFVHQFPVRSKLINYSVNLHTEVSNFVKSHIFINIIE